MHWKIDECPDANGNWTLREADGTEHGNTETCIATVYGGILEQELIETAPRLKEERDSLQEQVKLLREALEEGKQLLATHPEVGIGNRKVHFCYHKFRAALEATKEEA